MNYSREELNNKNIVELYQILNIMPMDYMPNAFSKEQLIEFILTPID
jgi:hypothetical protein